MCQILIPLNLTSCDIWIQEFPWNYTQPHSSQHKAFMHINYKHMHRTIYIYSYKCIYLNTCICIQNKCLQIIVFKNLTKCKFHHCDSVVLKLSVILATHSMSTVTSESDNSAWGFRSHQDLTSVHIDRDFAFFKDVLAQGSSE